MSRVGGSLLISQSLKIKSIDFPRGSVASKVVKSCFSYFTTQSLTPGVVFLEEGRAQANNLLCPQIRAGRYRGNSKKRICPYVQKPSDLVGKDTNYL